MARRVRRRSLPASKRDRRRIVLNSLSLPPPVPLSRPEDGGRYRQETSSPQEAKISARRGPGTPVGLRPPSIPGPRPTPVIASLTLFDAPQPNARLQQISALSGRHRHPGLRAFAVVRNGGANSPVRGRSRRMAPSAPRSEDTALLPITQARACSEPAILAHAKP